MLVHKGLKVRLYPNKAQRIYFKAEFDDTRFIWNHYLSKLRKRYKLRVGFIDTFEQTNGHKPKPKEIPKKFKFPNKYKLQKTINGLKNRDPWLKAVSASSLNMTIYKLVDTYKRFFKGLCKAPHFKSRKFNKKSFTDAGLPKQDKTAAHIIKLPKAGSIRARERKDSNVLDIIKDHTKQFTVTLAPTGYYYGSFSVKYSSQMALPKTGRAVGIDVGLDHLLNLSTGQKYDFKYYSKANEGHKHYWEKRLARRRRRAIRNIRQQEYYNKAHHLNDPVKPLAEYRNYRKAKQIVAKISCHARNQRYYYLQSLTTWLVRHFDLIAVEDINVQQMNKNHHLARAEANACWRAFRTMLAYKCKWYGKTLEVINKDYTSQVCHTCGMQTGKKPLGIRRFTCPYCGTVQDRDINASLNILFLGVDQAMLNNGASSLKPLPQVHLGRPRH